MLTTDQIEALVMKKYPKTDKERNCRQEQERLKVLRDYYRERLRTNQECPTLN